MKKALLIIGIIVLVLGVIALLFSALCRFAYRGTLDASPSFYANMRFDMRASLIIGIVLLVIGVVCFIVRKFAG